MNPSRHFIVFQRTDSHCATWLVRADSLVGAIERYLRDECGVEVLPDGRMRAPGCGSRYVTYTHWLECLESEVKSEDWCWEHGWEIRELQEAHWAADLAEVMCSDNPRQVVHHIAVCRPALRLAFPRSRARAFLWYLKTGPLVTFYRRKTARCRWPIEVLVRYQLPWETWPQVKEWHGTLDDILEQMVIEYPLP